MLNKTSCKTESGVVNRLPSIVLKIGFIIAVVGILPTCSRTPSSSLAEDRKKLGQSVYAQIQSSDLPWITIGRSVEGREIYAMEFGGGDSTVLIFGGFHGSEISGVQLVHRFAESLYADTNDVPNCKVVIIPVLSPDALVRGRRQNANRIDINRNFPTQNWGEKKNTKRYNHGEAPASEPETRLAMELIETHKPARIITVHAPLEVVNYDGPARALAERMGVHTGYPVSADIGYATPGSFGTYAGKERQIPTITLELPRGDFQESWWPGNRDALLEALRF